VCSHAAASPTRSNPRALSQPATSARSTRATARGSEHAADARIAAHPEPCRRGTTPTGSSPTYRAEITTHTFRYEINNTSACRQPVRLRSNAAQLLRRCLEFPPVALGPTQAGELTDRRREGSSETRRTCQGQAATEDPGLLEALTGHFGPHHTVACRRLLAHLDFLDDTIGALTEQINARTAAFDAVYKSLLPVPGFDRLTIDVIIAETGADMTRFRTAGDLASWTGVCPGGHESAGKRRRVSTTPGNRWLRRADRGSPSGGPNQGQLLRRSVPSDRPSPRAEQGRHRGRPFADRTRLAPTEHR
jgi:hypothetical protein